MSHISSTTEELKKHPSSLAILGLSALGVVFGDIGTSPLYTLKIVFALSGNSVPSHSNVLGLLSLLFWTLIIVTTLKYVSFAMKFDNKGEGGILALLSMLGVKKYRHPFIITCGLFGAALIYADGTITPAISVLSALEGLQIAFPSTGTYILPTAIIILTALFSVQAKGTARIGKIFGPIIALWFIALALLGIGGIIQNPMVLAAINPWYGVKFIFSHGYASFLVLGGVFLCVTGAEALYADMGHFGLRPIRLMWFMIVLPCLLLNYAGQAALMLAGVKSTENLFYQLCPEPLLIPLVILATLATIIASQAMISGTFSMTRQAILLGWLPRLRIVQTSAEGYGQIYIGAVNWILMVATLGLALFFKSSDNLGAAYGIAVSLTMFLTSILLFTAMRQIWNWPLWLSLVISACFMLIDLSFVAANMIKVLHGGYIPLFIAIVIYSVMLIWHRGVEAIARKVNHNLLSVPEFLTYIKNENLPRAPGSAIFLTRSLTDTPPIMLWHVKRNHSLHQKLLTLNIVTEKIPWVNESERITVSQLAPNFWRAKIHYGFMEHPDIPNTLKHSSIIHCCGLDLANATYYIGHEIIVHDEKKSAVLPSWQTTLFAMMVRNNMHATDLFKLPDDQLVEIGRQLPL